MPPLSLSAGRAPRPRGAVGRGHRGLFDRRRRPPARGARHAQGHQRPPRAEERLLYLGNHDELTGQLNRTRLTEELTRFLGSAGHEPRQGRVPARRRQRSHAGQRDLRLRRRRRGDHHRRPPHRPRLARQGLHRPLLVEQVRHRAAGLQRRGRRGDRPPPHGGGARQRHRYQRRRGGDHASRSARCCCPNMPATRRAAIGRALQALDIARGSRSDRLILYTALRAPGLRAPARRGHRRRDRARAQRPPHDPGAAADRHLAQPRARALRMPVAHEAARRLDRLGLRVHPGGRAVRARQAGRSPRARARRRAAALGAGHQAGAQRFGGDRHRPAMAARARGLRRQGGRARRAADHRDHRDRRHLRSARRPPNSWRR